MTYKVELTPKIERFLNKLQKQTSLRILEKLKKLREDPFRFLQHFEGDFYKLRIGDYRALIDVDFKNRLLKIRVLDKRGRIYKR
jgi:mRNA-degrading endonuclease RelE of RelBE toxin-antitoxin system